MPNSYRVPSNTTGFARICVFLILLMLLLLPAAMDAMADPPFGTFYYPPGNVPPGPPPNYNPVDTSYFMGEPTLPLPPPDSGGVYIWVDGQGSWNLAAHIYSAGNSLEQFHGSVLAVLDSPPSPGINILTAGFETFGDTSSGVCYKQNDRWGWYQWSENLYEIWWDVSTREWRNGQGDPNDFMRMTITGCAIDFNIWSSGHNVEFADNQIFLGNSMIRLSDVPGFTDTYPGITDPYQSQAGSDPANDPNITVFASRTGTGLSYNSDGMITAGQSYPCGAVLGENYGARFSGAFVYEGNGVQFSSSCLSDPCALNSPPVASSPNDTSIFICYPAEICLPGFTWSDPDGNLLSVEVIGGVLNGDTVCFMPVQGINTLTLICVDDCGAADTSVTNVNITVNSPPIAVCSADTSLFVCDFSEICLPGFGWDDPDHNHNYLEVVGGNYLDGSVCFIPVEGVNTIMLIKGDECGARDTCVTHITVSLNIPPAAVSPNDTSLFVCQSGEICLDGFTCSDPDNNISSVNVIGGILNGSTVCFTATEGVDTLTIIVTDICGAADTSTTLVTIDLNTPPTVSGPDTENLFVCDLSETCVLGYTYSDPDNNIVSIEAIGGYFSDGSICFVPSQGENQLSLIVTDACGAADTARTVVTVWLNAPPAVNVPADTIITFTCAPSEVCLGPFWGVDPDGNLDSCYVIQAGRGGSFDGSTYCFTPGSDGIYQVQYVCLDECGAADTGSVNVTLQGINEPPVVFCPGDTSIVICDMGEVCLGIFSYGDPNNNISDVLITGGTINDADEICFIPLIGQNIITLTVVDSCGLTASCSTTIDVSLNSPPTIICPDDMIIEVGDYSPICLDNFEFNDPDNNIVVINVVGGALVGNEICFTPVAGINTISVSCVDACGETDSCSVNVIVGFCSYIPGDANSDASINGLDITTMVNYFHSGPDLPDTCDCRPNLPTYPFFAGGDANGSCNFNGLDVVYLYNYLTNLVDHVAYCPTCPPTGGWILRDDLNDTPIIISTGAPVTGKTEDRED